MLKIYKNKRSLDQKHMCELLETMFKELNNNNIKKFLNFHQVHTCIKKVMCIILSSLDSLISMHMKFSKFLCFFCLSANVL